MAACALSTNCEDIFVYVTFVMYFVFKAITYYLSLHLSCACHGHMIRTVTAVLIYCYVITITYYNCAMVGEIPVRG